MCAVGIGFDPPPTLTLVCKLQKEFICMKKNSLVLLVLVVVMAAFSVCSAQNYTADNYTLETMWELNDLRNLSEDHVSVSYVETSTGDDGVVNFETTGIYKFVDGHIWFNSSTAFSEDQAGTMDACAYESEDVTGSFWYTDSMGEFDSLTVIPAGEYSEILANGWMKPVADFDEVMTACEEQDGMLVVKTATQIANTEYGYESEYVVDPESGLVQSVAHTFAGMDEEMGGSTTTTVVTYDEPYDFTCDSGVKLNEGDEITDLTVIINPGEENEETQEFHISSDTFVMINSLTYSELYTDEACTELAFSPELVAGPMTLYGKTNLPTPTFDDAE